MNVNQQLPAQTFQDGLILIVLNTLFNLFLCWYIDAIYPGEYGIGQPWYFLFSVGSCGIVCYGQARHV